MSEEGINNIELLQFIIKMKDICEKEDMVIEEFEKQLKIETDKKKKAEIKKLLTDFKKSIERKWETFVVNPEISNKINKYIEAKKSNEYINKYLEKSSRKQKM